MALDLGDIQGNLLRGYRSLSARHFALAIGDRAGAASFIAGLVSGNHRRSPQLTTADHWDEKPSYCLNLGITWTGLQRLGVPAGILAQFPAAFEQGPALRAGEPDADFPGGVGLGDVGSSSPKHWIVGSATTAPVDMLLSLYTFEHTPRRLESLSARLRNGFAGAGLAEVSAHDANALPNGTVHFGYRDGIAQPQIAGSPGRSFPDKQPRANPGDFLLGRDHVNLYGGNFLENIPPALGDNGTFAAFRILRQDVAGFEQLLKRWAKLWRLDPELIAAKLLGRWRNGAPLTLAPVGADPESPIDDHRLNDFDYAPGPGHEAYFDDIEGFRCPAGAHIRRGNPRGALVMGQPHSRRVVRRGMPYGPAFDPTHPNDGIERGLVGLFICGDIELQYEFVMRVWVNQDLSTHGLRGTRDPLIGAQPPGGGRFTLRTSDGRDPIVMTGLPRLVQTRGSLYLFIPGVGGLRYLASLGGSAA